MMAMMMREVEDSNRTTEEKVLEGKTKASG
jgi:hypothetical protein